jgi:hypothetical protein
MVQPLDGEAGDIVWHATMKIICLARDNGIDKFYIQYARGTHYKQAVTVHKTGILTAEHVVCLLFEMNKVTNTHEAVHYQSSGHLATGIPKFNADFGKETIFVSPTGEASRGKDP